MTNQRAENKRFDCVEMMHQGAARVREELAGMSVEEQAAYWRKSTKALLDRQARLRNKVLQVRERE